MNIIKRIMAAAVAAAFLPGSFTFAAPAPEERVTVIVEVKGDAVLEAQAAQIMGAQLFIATEDAADTEGDIRKTQAAVQADISFADTDADAWYGPAVRWAAAEGVVYGYSDTEFGPDDKVTREQLAAILYRHAKARGRGFDGEWLFPFDFSDADTISEYAYEPMCWMVMNGIINGMDDGTLSPHNNATRAQIAAMFMRFSAKIEM